MYCIDISTLLSDLVPRALRSPRYIAGVTLHNQVRTCEFGRALNVEPLIPIERSQVHQFCHVPRMPLERLARQVFWKAAQKTYKTNVE